jgi:Tfp pilus assembly protein PilF
MKQGIQICIGIALLGCSVGCSKALNSQVVKNVNEEPYRAELQDARVMFEMGHLDNAEQELRRILQADCDNKSAKYYLALIGHVRARRSSGFGRQPNFWFQTIPQQPVYR